MIKLAKKYQLWSYGGEGYSLDECDSIEECIELAIKNHAGENYYITKRVDMEITEVVKDE